MCAPWCGRPATRYAVICDDHWVTLDQYDRERIRESYRRTHGYAAYVVELAAEATVLHLRMERRISSGR